MLRTSLFAVWEARQLTPPCNDAAAGEQRAFKETMISGEFTRLGRVVECMWNGYTNRLLGCGRVADLLNPSRQSNMASAGGHNMHFVLSAKPSPLCVSLGW